MTIAATEHSMQTFKDGLQESHRKLDEFNEKVWTCFCGKTVTDKYSHVCEPYTPEAIDDLFNVEQRIL